MIRHKSNPPVYDANPAEGSGAKGGQIHQK
jgi:hypothetical protein